MRAAALVAILAAGCTPAQVALWGQRGHPAVAEAEAAGFTPGVRSRLVACESGGDAAAVSPSGTYRGLYQFDRRTWDGVVARRGWWWLAGRDPASVHPGWQLAAAAALYIERGLQPWPTCRWRV